MAMINASDNQRTMQITLSEQGIIETQLTGYEKEIKLLDFLREKVEKAEHYKRRYELLAPFTLQVEFEAALMWIAEKGDEEDLDLLQQVRKSRSEYISDLFDLAEQKILVRLHDTQQELQTAFGLTQAEFAHCLLGTDSEPVSQQARQTVEMLQRIRQSWESQLKPEALKKWFRKAVPLFDGRTPLEIVTQGQAERVWHLLGRFEEGIPS